MPDELHPLAPHHLPAFVVGPGESDVLLAIMGGVLLAAVLIVGNLYFQLHSLPERMAHRANKIQLQVVAVLCLLALFTHNNLFWVAALLLALVQIPDFSGPLDRIAASLEHLKEREKRGAQVSPPSLGPERPKVIEGKPHLTEVS